MSAAAAIRETPRAGCTAVDEPHATLLQGTRCMLRPLRAGEAAGLTRLTHDPQVTQFLFDEFDAAEWCAADGRVHNFDLLGIEPTGADRAGPVDAVGFLLLRHGTGCYRCSAEVAYWIGRPWWGCGIATEALGLVTAWAWAARPVLTRLQADIFDDHFASRRVVEKCGFHLEAIRRRCAVKSGRVIDLRQYAAHRP